jgi:hypothetical protein
MLPQIQGVESMPMYEFRIEEASGRTRREAMGFFRDEGALVYAQRMAGAAAIEVWKGAELVGRVDPRPTLAEPELTIPAE